MERNHFGGGLRRKEKNGYGGGFLRKKRENGKSAEKKRITPGMFFFYLLSSFIHIA